MIELYIFMSIFIHSPTTAHPHALILIHSPTELLHLQTWEQYDGSGGVAETGTELLDIDGDIVVDVIVTLTVNCVLFSIEYDGVIIHVLEVSVKSKDNSRLYGVEFFLLLSQVDTQI